MPQTVSGEGYRDFSEPRFFECESLEDVSKIRHPADKAHAIVAPADGGGMEVYKFRHGDTASATGLDILAANNSQVSGRWRRLTNGFVNIRLLGADPTGTDSSSDAFSSALDLLPDGGVIFCPHGVYKITESILLNRRISLWGEGFTSDYTSAVRAPTCIVGSGAFDRIVCNSYDTQVFDLQVDSASGAGDGIYVKFGHALINSVTVTNQTGSGIRVGSKSSGSGNSNHTQISHVRMLQNSLHGLYVHDVNAAPNANALMIDGFDARSNTGDGIRVENAIDNQFYGVATQLNGGYGIRLLSGAKGQEFFFPYCEADTSGTIILESGADQNLIFGYRQGTADAVSDSGANNTIYGRDTSRQGDLIWRKIYAREQRVAVPGFTGYLSLTQTATDTYELRNKAGGTTGVLKIRCDGGVGRLDTDDLFLNSYQVGFGANDSAGAGFRLLRVANT